MKCSHCKKKSHLEFKCQCEKVFCIHCRLPEVHVCLNYVSKPVDLVAVVAPKVQKI